MASKVTSRSTTRRQTLAPGVPVRGHHMRIWPVRDRAGAIVPSTYLVAMDYSGINYDYNDNVFPRLQHEARSAADAVPT